MDPNLFNRIPQTWWEQNADVVHQADNGERASMSAPKRGTKGKLGQGRTRHPEKWERNIAKHKRNLGQEYVSITTKKIVPARSIGHPCKDGCFTKIGMDKIQDIFKQFWSLGDKNQQNKYLTSLITEREPKRKYTKKEVSKRPVTICYSVKHSGDSFPVCKEAFISIHSIGRARLGLLLKKKREITPEVNPGENWERNIAKRKRNLGQEYVSITTKKTVAARTIGPPCKDGCFTRIGLNRIKDIFNEFWRLGDRKLQNLHLISLISEHEPKRKYTKKEVSMRPVTFCYSVKHSSEIFPVCKNGFMSIHGIGRARLGLLLTKKKESQFGIIPCNNKTSRAKRSMASGSQIMHVHEHIQKLPVTSSCYSRVENSHWQYLLSVGSITDLYKDYVVWMENNHHMEEIVSKSSYQQIFTKNYKISFQVPKKDVCNTCTLLKNEIDMKKAKDESVCELEERMATHLGQANAANHLLREHAMNPDPNVCAITIDLQQAFPCPKLAAANVYCKRKLWLYNFCVYDLSKEQGIMFVWDETAGGRSVDEVASCLVKWLQLQGKRNEDPCVRLRIFANNSRSQNKNIHLVLAVLQQVHHKRLARVDIVFMANGHSSLPCDQAFRAIKKKLSVMTTIESPQEYMDLITALFKDSYKVYEMKREEFLNFKSLSNHVTRRLGHVSFSKASQLVATNEFESGYLVKTDYRFDDHQDNTIYVSLRKGHQFHKEKIQEERDRESPTELNLSQVSIPIKYISERALHPAKVEDLESHLPFMQPTAKEWLHGLIEQQHMRQAEVETDSDRDEGYEDDPDDNFMEYEEVRTQQSDCSLPELLPHSSAHMIIHDGDNTKKTYMDYEESVPQPFKLSSLCSPAQSSDQLVTLWSERPAMDSTS